MGVSSKLVCGVALSLFVGGAAAAQTGPAGDGDDQLVISGCVMHSPDTRTAGPQSILVWSRGDHYLASPRVDIRPSEKRSAVGTTGTADAGTVFYWLDDDDDFAKYAGQRVEIVGELSDEIDHADIELTPEGDVTDVRFDAGGREAEARIPTAWFGPAVRGKDIDADVAFRSVDVEDVTVLGACEIR